MTFVKGRSGNPRGSRTRAGEDVAAALEAEEARQNPGGPRGVTNATMLARRLWADATKPGSGTGAAQQRYKAAQLILAYRLGRPAESVAVRALVAQAAATTTVPWDDTSAPGLEYVNGNVSDRLGLVDAGRGDELVLPASVPTTAPAVVREVVAVGDSAPAPPHDAQEMLAAGKESTSHPEQVIYGTLARALDDLRDQDPSGLGWTTLRAAMGLPPQRPPWLTDQEWNPPAAGEDRAARRVPSSPRPYRGTTGTKPAPDSERRLYPDQAARSRYGLGVR